MPGAWWRSRPVLSRGKRTRVAGAALLTAGGMWLRDLAAARATPPRNSAVARTGRRFCARIGDWCHTRGHRALQRLLGDHATLFDATEALLAGTPLAPVRPRLGFDIIRTAADALFPSFEAHCGRARLAHTDLAAALATWADTDGGLVWRIAEDPPHYFQFFHILRMVDCGFMDLEHPAIRHALLRYACILDLAVWHPLAATIIAYELQCHNNPPPCEYLRWARVLDTIAGTHGDYAERVGVLFGTIGVNI